MPVRLFPIVWSHFIFNLLLQLADGILTYQVLLLGIPEGNPLVATTIEQWGEVWGLLYWKVFACVLLSLIFSLRHRRRALTIKAFTLTSTVYGLVAAVALYELIWQSVV